MCGVTNTVSVKGSAGGIVKWFAPSTCRRLSVRSIRAKVRWSSNLNSLTRLFGQPCDGTLNASSKGGAISGMTPIQLEGRVVVANGGVQPSMYGRIPAYAPSSE